MFNVAAVHLIMASKELGSEILSASMLIFGAERHRYDWVSTQYLSWAAGANGTIDESNKQHVEFLLNAGAQVISPDMFASRIVGMQTLHLTKGTIWQTHYASHISHYAYLFARTEDTSKLFRKGFNLDAEALNAANRFIAEADDNFPTGASSPEAGLLYIKELYIGAKRLLGHDMTADGNKTKDVAAPVLAIPSVSLPGIGTGNPIPVFGKPTTGTPPDLVFPTTSAVPLPVPSINLPE